MAQDVAQSTFSTLEVQPVGAVARSYAQRIQLAASTVYPAGQALSLVPSSSTLTYGKYVQGASDGTQLAECILRFACATDASGNITEGGAATGGEWGQTQKSTTAWFGGVFRMADIYTGATNGLNAAGVTAMGGKLQCNGALLSF